MTENLSPEAKQRIEAEEHYRAQLRASYSDTPNQHRNSKRKGCGCGSIVLSLVVIYLLISAISSIGRINSDLAPKPDYEVYEDNLPSQLSIEAKDELSKQSYSTSEYTTVKNPDRANGDSDPSYYIYSINNGYKGIEFYQNVDGIKRKTLFTFTKIYEIDDYQIKAGCVSVEFEASPDGKKKFEVRKYSSGEFTRDTSLVFDLIKMAIEKGNDVQRAQGITSICMFGEYPFHKASQNVKPGSYDYPGLPVQIIVKESSAFAKPRQAEKTLLKN